MKKLPKRDGYKPKPLPRMPTLEEILIRQAAGELVRVAQDSGIDVDEFMRRRLCSPRFQSSRSRS
jgi:hypothetical protein